MLILGDGKLGLLCAQVAATTGAGVSVMGKHEDKLDLARSFGCATFLFGDRTQRFDIVVEGAKISKDFTAAKIDALRRAFAHV